MMKIFVQLNSNVLKKTIGVVASAFGHEMIDTIDLADAIITTDIRMMLSCLKQGKRVVQFIVSPSDEPASGLMTSYPELFTACRVIEGKGVDGCETLINFLVTNSPRREVP